MRSYPRQWLLLFFSVSLLLLALLGGSLAAPPSVPVLSIPYRSIGGNGSGLPSAGDPLLALSSLSAASSGNSSGNQSLNQTFQAFTHTIFAIVYGLMIVVYLTVFTLIIGGVLAILWERWYRKPPPGRAPPTSAVFPPAAPQVPPAVAVPPSPPSMGVLSSLPILCRISPTGRGSSCL